MTDYRPVKHSSPEGIEICTNEHCRAYQGCFNTGYFMCLETERLIEEPKEPEFESFTDYDDFESE